MSYSYTSIVPLRRSSVWPKYTDDYVLPVVYGEVSLEVKPYDEEGALWFIADHPIESVDSVSVDGAEISSYKLQNGIDNTGKPVSVVEISPPAVGKTVIASVRGKLHPDTGEQLNRPDLILHDWLVNICGQSFAVSDFDYLRSFSQKHSIVCGGLIDELHTIQSATDSIVQGMGLAWGAHVSGVAIHWPPVDLQPPLHAITTKSDRFTATASLPDVYTRLQLTYHANWATGFDKSSIQLQSESAEDYGVIEKTISCPWIQSSAYAEYHAQKLIEWYGSPIWKISAQSKNKIQPGLRVSIDHPYSPVSAATVIDISSDDRSTEIIAVATSGGAGAVSVLSRGAYTPSKSGASENYIYSDGKLTYTVLDENGIGIARASVTLDGTVTRLTDNQGKVQFTVSAGTHQLVIDAPGFVSQTVTVSL